MNDTPNAGPVGALDDLIAAARRAGRARFSMQSAVGDGDESLSRYSGVVDLRSGEYVSSTMCFVDGLSYGRESEAETWTSAAWQAGHLPISPLWLLLVLHGAEAAPPAVSASGGDVSISAVCDLHEARRSSGVELAGLGGDPARQVSATVTADSETLLVRRIAAAFGDWSFVCEYSDFGTDEALVAPTSSTPVDADLSPARRWLTRRFPSLSIMTSAASIKRSSEQPPN